MKNLFLVFSLLISLTISNFSQVVISGYGGTHDADVATAFLLGYSSYDGSEYPNEIYMDANTLQHSLNLAVSLEAKVVVRSTSGLSTGIRLAKDYPNIQVIMPAGSNTHTQVYFGDIKNCPVVVTGAGIFENQTGYKLEFFDIDPITSNNLSSYSNGYIAGKLCYLSEKYSLSVQEVRPFARMYSSTGSFDIENGFGTIDIERFLSAYPDITIIGLP